MSSALPIVASDTAPLHEVIVDHNTGLLVDFFSSSDLAASVSTLLSDRSLALELGRNARQLVLKRFSLEQCLPRQLALLQLVASNSMC